MRAIVKGIASGSLIVGSLLNDLGFAVQAVLFIIGLAVFMDSILQFGREAFIATTIIFAVFGGIVSMVLSLAGSGVIWIIFSIILAVIIYLERILHLVEKVKK